MLDDECLAYMKATHTHTHTHTHNGGVNYLEFNCGVEFKWIEPRTFLKFFLKTLETLSTTRKNSQRYILYTFKYYIGIQLPFQRRDGRLTGLTGNH